MTDKKRQVISEDFRREFLDLLDKYNASDVFFVVRNPDGPSACYHRGDVMQVAYMISNLIKKNPDRDIGPIMLTALTVVNEDSAPHCLLCGADTFEPHDPPKPDFRLIKGGRSQIL